MVQKFYSQFHVALRYLFTVGLLLFVFSPFVVYGQINNNEALEAGNTGTTSQFNIGAGVAKDTFNETRQGDKALLQELFGKDEQEEGEYLLIKNVAATQILLFVLGVLLVLFVFFRTGFNRQLLRKKAYIYVILLAFTVFVAALLLSSDVFVMRADASHGSLTAGGVTVDPFWTSGVPQIGFDNLSNQTDLTHWGIPTGEYLNQDSTTFSLTSCDGSGLCFVGGNFNLLTSQTNPPNISPSNPAVGRVLFRFQNTSTVPLRNPIIFFYGFSNYWGTSCSLYPGYDTPTGIDIQMPTSIMEHTTISSGIRYYPYYEVGRTVQPGEYVDVTFIEVVTNNVPYSGSNLHFPCVYISGFYQLPPSAPVIIGPSSGVTYTTYTFDVSSTDYNGGDDIVRFGIDWDNDNIVDQWTQETQSPRYQGNISLIRGWSAPGTKTFNVLAEDQNGDRSGWSSHTITVVAPTPTVDMRADGQDGPIQVANGASVQFDWTSNYVTSCDVSPTGWTGTNGSQAHTVSASDTYTVSCTGPWGPADDFVDVQVTPNIYAPGVILNANPSTVLYGNDSTLDWLIDSNDPNGVSCTKSGDWSGTFTNSAANTGSQVVTNLTSNKTYTLTCNNAAGVGSDTASVTVTPPAITISITHSPTNIPYNSTTNVSWNVTTSPPGVPISCTAFSGDAGWPGSRPTSGTYTTQQLTAPNNYFALQCNGPLNSTRFGFTNVQVQPVSACSDTLDNDGDGRTDKNDPGCWANPDDPATYDPDDTSEGACGDLICEPQIGETPLSCPLDCIVSDETEI